MSKKLTTPPSKWDHRFMALAANIATWSKDQSTKVGAVIVGPHREIRATGYNGCPRGVRDDVPSRQTRPTKYLYMSHAEESAVGFGALNGASLEGCTIYATMFPCATCARLIIASGIVRVVAPRPDRPDWAEQHEAAMDMFDEAKVRVMPYEAEAEAEAEMQT